MRALLADLDMLFRLRSANKCQGSSLDFGKMVSATCNERISLLKEKRQSPLYNLYCVLLKVCRLAVQVGVVLNDVKS